MKPFKKALVYEFEGTTDLTEMAHEYAEEVNTITATDDYQNVLTAEHLKGVDCFLVGVFDDFKNEYYDLDTLKYVGIDWTGYEKLIDKPFLDQHGIAFTNCAGQATEGVAELMLNMLLNLLRHTPEAMAYAKADGPSFADFKGNEIGSRTIAIRGLGDIGSRFAEICDFFGATIRYTSISPKEVPYESVELEKLTNGVDVFAVTTPNSDKTRRTITKDILAGLNENAIILDPGQFETFVEQDLLAFLQENPGVKYWSDVNQSDVWKAVKDDFLALPNVYVTPHSGFFTHENRPRALKLVRNNIEQYISNQ